MAEFLRGIFRAGVSTVSATGGGGGWKGRKRLASSSTLMWRLCCRDGSPWEEDEMAL